MQSAPCLVLPSQLRFPWNTPSPLVSPIGTFPWALPRDLEYRWCHKIPHCFDQSLDIVTLSVGLNIYAHTL